MEDNWGDLLAGCIAVFLTSLWLAGRALYLHMCNSMISQVLVWHNKLCTWIFFFTPRGLSFSLFVFFKHGAFLSLENTASGSHVANCFHPYCSKLNAILFCISLTFTVHSRHHPADLPPSFWWNALDTDCGKFHRSWNIIDLDPSIWFSFLSFSMLTVSKS